mgnify:CR=1 FL=1
MSGQSGLMDFTRSATTAMVLIRARMNGLVLLLPSWESMIKRATAQI